MTTEPIWKHPADVLVRGLDFTDLVPAGTTIQGTPVWAVAPAGALTAAHDSVVGALIAKAKLEAGNADVDYVVTGTVVMSNGETYHRALNVNVRTGL